MVARWNFLLIVLLIFLSSLCFAESFQPNASYQVCFTPGQNCTRLITKSIDQAQHQVLVQAYSFTSMAIAKSLVSAEKRHVVVKVILDKSQFTNDYYAFRYLMNHHLPIWCDYRPRIAHNKVMIIDDQTVITGSFNFTSAAQYKNAENLLVIHDSHLAQCYTHNWYRRLKRSKQFKSKQAYYAHRTFVKAITDFLKKILRKIAKG